MKIYCHPQVQSVYELHQSIIEDRGMYHTVKAQLTLFVDHLYQQYQAGDERTAIEVKNYHPDHHQSSTEEIFAAKLDLAAFQQTIAREYGYADWHDVIEHANVAFDAQFEQCVNLLLAGEMELLENETDKNPALLSMHSAYGHRAGLIHYIAANGVELWRQVVPENLVEITQMLLRQGADAEQTHNIYNGNETLLALIETSAHPQEAGIAKELMAVIKKESR